MTPLLIEPDPGISPGCACSECVRPYGLSHLGSCSRAYEPDGSGIVGFRAVAPLFASRVVARSARVTAEEIDETQRHITEQVPPYLERPRVFSASSRLGPDEGVDVIATAPLLGGQ